MVSRTLLSEPARRLYDRLDAAGQLAQLEEASRIVSDLVAAGLSIAEILERFDEAADSADVDTTDPDRRELRAAWWDLAALAVATPAA